MRTLLLHLEGQGARVKRTRKGVRVLFPNGMTLGMHWTESDHRAVLNSRAVVRRAGFTWPFDHQPRRVHAMAGTPLSPERQLDLAAAIELAGEGPTSIVDIATHAGVSPPTARKAMIKEGFEQINRTTWVRHGAEPEQSEAERYPEIAAARDAIIASSPVDVASFTPDPDDSLEIPKVVVRSTRPPTDPRDDSWLIVPPAELLAMARQMGLQIEVRVWRDPS